MEKILAPADKVLTEIGRLVLLKPLFFGVLLISAIAITIFSQVGDIGHSKPLELAATPVAPVIDSLISADINETVLAITPPSSTTDTISEWQTLTIHSGDSLSTLFKNNGFSGKEMLALSHLAGAKVLHHLKLGQEMRFHKNADGQLDQLIYAVSDKSTLNVIRSGNTYKASTQSTPIAAILPVLPALAANTVTQTPTTQSSVPVTKISAKEKSKEIVLASDEPTRHYVSGRINRSLAVDARKAGLSAKQVSQLTQMFSPKKLTKKIRPGDEFRVFYEASTKATGGKKSAKKSTGNILAAQLVINDKTYQLIRFTDPKGHTDYYSPQGESMRDGLLRAPLHFERISSPFSSSRLDPVLGFHRPHQGVDFAAPLGTPVQAAGEGVLAEVGYKGGYGKAIVIRHDGKYSTLYGHLSKFASLREGQVVHKGQIIGYVGQTGFSTGPHLHYEIRVNNIAANPMTVALPGTFIPKAYRNQFLMQSKILLAQLNTSKRQVQLAQRADSTKRS